VVNLCVSETLDYLCCGVTVLCLCQHVMSLELFFTFRNALCSRFGVALDKLYVVSLFVGMSLL
jgi:hypothetical protein